MEYPVGAAGTNFLDGQILYSLQRAWLCLLTVVFGMPVQNTARGLFKTRNIGTKN
jgi:hypothetical protein